MTWLNTFPICGPRIIRNFNVGWRFKKGPAAGGEREGHDDSSWLPVNLPHGLEILPLDASGGVNYQGEAWYRTAVGIPARYRGR